MALANPSGQLQNIHLDYGMQRTGNVLKELVFRRDIMTQAKKQELLWRLLFFCLSAATFALILLRLSPQNDMIVVPFVFYPLMLVFNCLVLVKYRAALHALHKANINFAVVRHHLVGMLEVRLCSCLGQCDCKEKFRREVLQRYGINL